MSLKACFKCTCERGIKSAKSTNLYVALNNLRTYEKKLFLGYAYYKHGIKVKDFNNF